MRLLGFRSVDFGETPRGGRAGVEGRGCLSLRQRLEGQVSEQEGLWPAMERPGMEGHYEGPGWDRPCPRLNPNGRPMCAHDAGKHDERGICAACAADPAAEFRACASPVPEGERGRNPMLVLLGRDVRVIVRGSTRMVAGRLAHADGDVVVLDAIPHPMRVAENGGTVPRECVEDIALIQDSWREGRRDKPPPYGRR